MDKVGRVIARNSLFGIAGQLALKLLSFAYSLAVIRQLGNERFGEYSTVIAFVGILAVFADFGMAGYAVREIAKDRGRAASLFANMVVLRLLLSAGVLVMNVILALALGYELKMVGWIALASVGLLLYAFQGPTSIVLQGFEQIGYTSSYNVLNQTILIAVGALLLWQGWGVTGVIIASFFGIVFTAGLGWRTARRLTELPWRIDPGLWLSLIRASIPFGITTFATMLSFKVDTILLSLWRSHAEVGWYNAAYNLIFSLMILSSGFNSALVPSLSRQHQSDPASVAQFYIRSMRLLWTATLPIAVGITLLAHRVVALFYGPDYAPSGLALQILIWALPALTLTSLCGAMTTVLHRERSTARVNIINATFNITLNLWAIPRYGLLGAAVMTVVTELLGLIQYTLLLRDAFPLRTILSAFRAPLLAVAVMAGVILLSWQLHVVVIIVGAALAYAVTLLVAGGLKVSELKQIVTTLIGAIAPQRMMASK